MLVGGVFLKKRVEMGGKIERIMRKNRWVLVVVLEGLSDFRGGVGVWFRLVCWNLNLGFVGCLLEIFSKFFYFFLF